MTDEQIVRTGIRFGRLVVSTKGPPSSGGNMRWYCDCDCGGRSLVRRSDLLDGRIKSCGCYGGTKGRKHGEAGKTVEYVAWHAIVQRCTNPQNPNYRNYGGRGIFVCNEWKSDYSAFLGHVGRRPAEGYSIDRINNNDGYRPENVRWATRSEQARNKRRKAEWTPNT